MNKRLARPGHNCWRVEQTDEGDGPTTGAIGLTAEARAGGETREIDVYEAYWGDLKDISQPEEITKICEKVGIDPEMLLKRIKDQDIKDRLKQNTEEVIERGGFGSPTMFVNGESMFFGNDRLFMLQVYMNR